MADNIIRNGSVVANDWQVITDAQAAARARGKVILPLTAFIAHAELLQRKDVPGLLLNSDELPENFPGKLSALPVIAVNFPAFTDGRGFTIGNLLREQYHYTGELRAYGSFIRDQLYYLKRCGFDSFEFTTNVDLAAAAKSLNDFSNDYQVSANQPLPLFRRR
jgi:uncharacterized protein (DUF934 family)